MVPFTEDVSSFYATIYGGLIIGLLFDINRSLKSNFKILKYFSYLKYIQEEQNKANSNKSNSSKNKKQKKRKK